MENKEDILKNIGKRIKKFRTEKGLSQKDLAEMLSLGQSIIALYETGEREIKITTLLELTKIFDVSPNDILGYDDSVSKTEKNRINFSEIEITIFEEIKKNKDFMVFVKENTQEKIKKLLKLWKNVERIIPG
ncbi:helix-turn-helix transcriptional regulator [Neobacillus sp.]|uniref:helix-turn-helix domain-containing protein n=1 Tax=Neobacillus sp. TaxID=2675273 RepID=UPI00289D7786|nr:helix-turn-helix transcriptional regulator [Neobacillus sp.]